MTTTPLVVRCNAKINLYLNVIGVRDDGYHDIETIFQSVDLHDTLRLQSRSDDYIDIVCDHPDLTDRKSNLVYRAAVLFREKYGIEHGVTIAIEKKIPLGGGLAGGSTDAAGTLRGLAKLWSVDADETAMHEMAASLGADVPFCMHGGTAAATGIGTDLEILDTPRPWWVVLVLPDTHVPTAQVYHRLDARGFDPQHGRFQKAVKSVLAGNLADALYNSMEPVVLEDYPMVHAARNALVAAGATDVLMSGSGAAVYALAPTEEQARRLADRVPPDPNRRVIVCKTTGPELNPRKNRTTKPRT